MGAEPDTSLPPPEPDILGKDNQIQDWKADMMSALGESVSFGRFLAEPLEWGKWSAFAHNRYLEEAAVQARPGSVAQKKAFFDAHYASRKRKSEAGDVAGADGDRGGFEAAEDGGTGTVASCSSSAAESSCMTDEPPAAAEEACGGGCEDGVVDCGGSASDEPVHVLEELEDRMEGSDDRAVLQSQEKQDLCTDSSMVVDAVEKEPLKEISILNQDITDSVKKRRIQMSSLLSKRGKLSSPPTSKKGQSSFTKRRWLLHAAKENTSPPSADSSNLGTASTPKKRSALHMSMSFTRCETGNASLSSRNLGTTISERISQFENATRPAENTQPHELMPSRKTSSSVLPEIAPRTSQVNEERSSHIMKIKEKLFGSTFPSVHQKTGITKERKFNDDPGFKESRQSFCFKARLPPNFNQRTKPPKDSSQQEEQATDLENIWLQTTQEIPRLSESGHLSNDINQSHQKSKRESNGKQICCFPIRKMY